MLRANDDLSSDLIVGENYRLIIDARASLGSNIRIGLGGPYINTPVINTSFTTYNLDFTAKSTNSDFIYFYGMKPGMSIWIKSIELKKIEVVLDKG